MNAEINFTAMLERAPFDAATCRASEWRGRCLNWFARAELAVTECLVTMSDVPERGAAVVLPHLVGQRYEALGEAVAPGGPFAVEGQRLAAALTRFREYDLMRPMLCHGVADVTLDVKGRWTLVLCVVTLRGGREERSSLAVREDEADDLRRKVGNAAHELCQHAANFRARLAALPTPLAPAPARA